jgi:hypothetical protein
MWHMYWLLNFRLEYAISKAEEHQEGLKLNGTHQGLASSDAGRRRSKRTSSRGDGQATVTRGSVLVKALGCNPEGRGFGTPWGEILTVPNPSGRTRTRDSLSL